MERIESPQNARIKAAAKLRLARGRHQSDQFLIDGARETLRALASGAGVETLILCRDFLNEHVAKQLLAAGKSRSVEVWETSPAAFAKVAYGDRVEGVVAIARSQPGQLSDWSPPSAGSIYVVLEGIEKPGNLGAIFRTADAVGVAGIILTQTRVTPENSNAIRASLGTVFSVPYVMAGLDDVFPWLEKHGVRRFAARVQASHEHWDITYFSAIESNPVALVLGSEAEGLTPAWQDPAVTGVRIPQAGIADSLNLSVAAGILLYEVARQRRLHLPQRIVGNC
ncbi:MAG: RNA methyltransferase [Planctomycetaceae bacterium]|nr:RNA methyltransferase [Planctomycetaceae bacterium]